MEQSHDLLNNDLQINSITQSHLTEIAKWGKFLAIVGFIFCGVEVIVAFAVGSFMSNLSEYNSAYSTGLKTGVTIVYLVIAVIMFFPCLFLYKFSVKMQQALRTISQENFEISFQNLKAMFRYQGILAIIVVVLLILSLLGILARGI